MNLIFKKLFNIVLKFKYLHSWQQIYSGVQPYYLLKRKQLIIGSILILVIVIGIIITVGINYEELIGQEFTLNLHFTRTSDVDREKIFEIMSDVKQYPNILPRNIHEVKIINRTDNVIFAEETISERGIEVKLLVKHEIFPPERHEIEIIGGYANGTKIVLFYENDSKTTISSDILIKATGPLIAIILFMGPNNFESAFNTVIQAFEEYTV